MLFTFKYPRFFRIPIARLLRLPRRQYRKIGVSLDIDRSNLSITESGMFTAPGMRPEEYSSFSLTSIRRAPSVCLYSDRPLEISDPKNISHALCSSVSQNALIFFSFSLPGFALGSIRMSSASSFSIPIAAFSIPKAFSAPDPL